MYAYLMMIVVVVSYAGNVLVGKAISDLPPFTITFFRLLVAFLCLLPLGWKSAWRKRSVFFYYKKPLLLLTITGVTFFNTCIYAALQFTTATNASILETVVPVVTVILSAFMLGERLKFSQWMGVALSLFGALWVVMEGQIFQVTKVDWNIGDAIMVGAIACWSIYSILAKQYVHLFPRFGLLLLMTGMSLLILFPIVCIEWIQSGVPTFTLPGHVFALLYLGVFPSFLSLLFYNQALERLGASKTSIFLNLVPVVTILGAAIWLEESITFFIIVGALLVIGGVIMTIQLQEKGSMEKRRQQ